jgi:hypothetical protein
MRHFTVSIGVFSTVILSLALVSPRAGQTRDTPGAVGRTEQTIEVPTIHPHHPRLFFTDEELPALRDRIATHYRSEFQDFLDLLDDPQTLNRRQKRIEVNWGGLNYAFVAALDPAEMRSLGFNFEAPLDNARAYCDRAMAYNRELLPGVSAGETQTGSIYDTGYPSPKYLSVVTTYDWCFPHLTDDDRRAIVDAYLSAYEQKYKGRDPLTMEVGGMEMLANERTLGDLEDLLGIVAFHGDPYPDAPTQRELLTAFKAMWLDRYLLELNHFYQPATGWHEGPGGYLANSFPSASIPTAMFSSALGVDYIATTPFFSQYAVFVEANILPHGLFESPYYDRWGTISGGIASPSCRSLRLNAGMLTRANHPNAALAKWAYEKSAGDRNCATTVTDFGGPWANAVLFWFMFGDREIEARSPVDMKLPNAMRLGLGQYVMKSGYTRSDSHVAFFAQEHKMYGHDHPHYGTFSLHKFGNLIVHPGNSKSGEGELERGPGKGALFQNVLTLHKGASDLNLGWDGRRVDDPVFGPRGITQVGKAGTVFAETLGGRGFDYVGYDSSLLWNPSTATVAQREFVYLHGPADKEFVVVLDRFAATNPAADEKVWRIWIPTQPTFVNGDERAPRPGKWTSSNSDTIELTNREGTLQGENFRSAPTHGRFFMKTLWPAQPVISFIGGPGMEFQGGDDDGTTPWGTPAMTRAEREYLGWGRVEVRPSVAQRYDLFLNVIQFGDATGLSAMAPVERVESEDGKLAGAHIGDRENQWVVMMARDNTDAFDLRSAGYRFTAAAPRSRQLLLDMARSTTYYVAVSAAGAETSVAVGTEPTSSGTPIMSNDQGVLSFEIHGTEVR